jgi:ferredoxin
MPYVITEICVGTCDTACADVCPVDCIRGPLPLDAIRSAPAPRSLQLYIDPEACICCAVCVPACPVGAIFDEDDVPAASRASIIANASFFGA